MMKRKGRIDDEPIVIDVSVRKLRGGESHARQASKQDSRRVCNAANQVAQNAHLPDTVTSAALRVQSRHDTRNDSRYGLEDTMNEALEELVLEAAGEGYLTDAQVVAVAHELTSASGSRAPEEVGITELMQLIELARTGGLDETDCAYRNITSYHQAARSAGQSGNR